MRRHLGIQYPSIKGNKIYSDFTFTTAVLLILSLHYEGQIAFTKLLIMKLPGITFCERSHLQNCINPGSFIPLVGAVYGWQLLSVLHMFPSNGIHSYTDILLLQERCHLGWMKTWSVFLTGICYVFCYSYPETTCEPDAIPRHWFLPRPFHYPATPSCALPTTYDGNYILY